MMRLTGLAMSRATITLAARQPDLVLAVVFGYWAVYATWLAAASLGHPLGDDRQRALISEVATLPSVLHLLHLPGAPPVHLALQPGPDRGAPSLWRCSCIHLAARVARLRRGRATPFPSPATICYLAFYVLTLWGLLSFPLAPRTGIERATFWLDTGTVAVGGGMLVWHFVVHPLAMAAARIPSTGPDCLIAGAGYGAAGQRVDSGAATAGERTVSFASTTGAGGGCLRRGRLVVWVRQPAG